jgi:FAD/FMN-containing dehydrogenase
VEVTLLLLGAVAGAGAACEDTAIRTASSSARREAARRSMVNAISPQTQALMRRTKQLFDPTNKLNPGEFGFI